MYYCSSNRNETKNTSEPTKDLNSEESSVIIPAPSGTAKRKNVRKRKLSPLTTDKPTAKATGSSKKAKRGKPTKSKAKYTKKLSVKVCECHTNRRPLLIN